MIGEINKGLIRFAYAGGGALNFGDEFSILSAPEPDASPVSVVIISRREEAITSNTTKISIKTGTPILGEYVVVKRQQNGDGMSYFEAVPAEILDASALSKEREIISKLGEEVDGELAPVRIVEGKVKLDPSRMITDYAYRVVYRGHPRLFVRNPSGQVEVYRVV